LTILVKNLIREIRNAVISASIQNSRERQHQMDSALLKYFGPDSADSCSNCVKLTADSEYEIHFRHSLKTTKASKLETLVRNFHYHFIFRNKIRA